eukprot:Skav210378  [mRNA]  locus=scaffold1526:95367:96119:+ [translate_table: standard]
MEYNVVHGIDHFFVYTFPGNDEAVKDVLMPYITAGLVTRIHSVVDPTPDMVGVHFEQVIRDCLFRAKNHATWVIPSFDTDEYFHLSTGRMFPGHPEQVPQDYMRTMWDAIRMAQRKRLSEVRSISFNSIRSAAPQSNEAVLISSPWREARRGAEVLPKYAFNAHIAWDVWLHWVNEPEQNYRAADIRLDESIGFVQHYSIPWTSQLTTATKEDTTLREDAEMLQAAIEARFGESLRPLLRRLNQNLPSGA